jgi:hypothetical protein
MNNNYLRFLIVILLKGVVMKNTFFILLCIILLSCSDNGSTEPDPLKVIKTTTLHAYDFAPNFFFLDTVYKSIYINYYSNYLPVIPGTEIAKYNRIKEIELWMSVDDIKQGDNSAFGIAFADLNPIKTLMGEKYPASMKKEMVVDGKIERGYFVKIDSTEYTIDLYLGIISINNLQPDRFYSISYRIEGETTNSNDDIFYGNFSSQTLETDTLIFKLIYRPNIQPGYSSLWQRQMKNKYYVGEKFIDYSKSEVEIYYIGENNQKRTYLDEDLPLKLVTILGVDRFNKNGMQIPDGRFDLKAWTLDKESGILTFPYLEPFNEAIIEFFSINERSEKSEKYIYPEIYNNTKEYAKLVVEKDKYLIVFNKLGK